MRDFQGVLDSASHVPAEALRLQIHAAVPRFMWVSGI